MNISLPKELENMVNARVESGLYSSASEVVREALRNMLVPTTDNDSLSEAEIEYLRKKIDPQLVALKNGTLDTYSLEDVMREVDTEIFGE